MKSSIWNFWASRYDRLWVQKYSLKPTRNYILNALSENKDVNNIKVLDLGCGTGQLISEMAEFFSSPIITGVDFSEKMLDISKSRNPGAIHMQLNADELDKLKGNFDVIICSHSFPYYKSPEKVLHELNKLLKNDGILLMAFASGNNVYDKFALSFVKLTTGPAYYPSDRVFREIVSPYFHVADLQIIKEKFFMPRIALYKLKGATK